LTIGISSVHPQNSDTETNAKTIFFIL